MWALAYQATRVSPGQSGGTSTSPHRSTLHGCVTLMKTRVRVLLQRHDGRDVLEAPAHYVTDESAMDLMTTVFSRAVHVGKASSRKRVSKIVFHHMNRAMELWENGPTLNGLRQDVAAALGKPVGDALVSSIAVCGCWYAGRELFEEVYKTVSQLDRGRPPLVWTRPRRLWAFLQHEEIGPPWVAEHACAK